jgi:hypothetical protein
VDKFEGLEMRVGRLEEDSKESRTDLHELRAAVKELAEEVKGASVSLMRIAENTTTMRELIDIYDKWKGFTWVVKKGGFWVAILIAFLAGAMTALINYG